VPRIIVAETYPSLTRALADDAPTPPAVDGSGSLASSVATPQGTFQSLRAVRESNGTAVVVSNDEIKVARTALREREGLLVEFSSAMPLAAVQKLVASGDVSSDERIVMLLTSTGLKDPEEMNVHREAPDVEPTLASLADVLEQEYGFVA
jgi:threonine synthase